MKVQICVLPAVTARARLSPTQLAIYRTEVKGAQICHATIREGRHLDVMVASVVSSFETTWGK